jgi:hypothetical protein
MMNESYSLPSYTEKNIQHWKCTGFRKAAGFALCGLCAILSHPVLQPPQVGIYRASRNRLRRAMRIEDSALSVRG